jgi:hypothetical protein
MKTPEVPLPKYENVPSAEHKPIRNALALAIDKVIVHLNQSLPTLSIVAFKGAAIILTPNVPLVKLKHFPWATESA